MISVTDLTGEAFFFLDNIFCRVVHKTMNIHFKFLCANYRETVDVAGICARACTHIDSGNWTRRADRRWPPPPHRSCSHHVLYLAVLTRRRLRHPVYSIFYHGPYTAYTYYNPKMAIEYYLYYNIPN